MFAHEIYTEIWQPIAFIEETFAQLKPLVLRPPRQEPTEDTFFGWPKENDWKFVPSQAVDTIAASLMDAAEFYGMNPKRLRVMIRSPKTQDDQIKADLQRRVVEFHKDFFEFITEQKICMCFKMKVTAHGVSLNPPPRKRKSNKDRMIEKYGG